MICAWDKLLRVLPVRIREELNKYDTGSLQEIRLRLNDPPLLCSRGDKRPLSGIVKQDDLDYVLNTSTRYSPWAAGSVTQGYLTVDGGHRIGLCGEAVMKNGDISGMRRIRSLNIRVSRDIPGVSAQIRELSGSLLVIGPPGSGKTTLLRDLIRRVAEKYMISVADERAELFPAGCFSTGSGIDILTGCPKALGIEMLLRTMGPEWIAVDEITAPGDCDALIQAGWCGVKVLATAHALHMRDLRSRSIYRPILDSGIFSAVCVINRDQTYTVERLCL